MRINETRPLHLQLFGQRIHLADENVNRREFRVA